MESKKGLGTFEGVLKLILDISEFMINSKKKVLRHA